jgi:alanyl-tRNA synthetase
MDVLKEIIETLSVGDTIDCRPDCIIPGNEVFILHDTHGIPLEVSLGILIERRWTIEWPTFIISALNHGWSKKNIINKIRYACNESGYGKGYFRCIR